VAEAVTEEVQLVAVQQAMVVKGGVVGREGTLT
jgi:hypothetical protein